MNFLPVFNVPNLLAWASEEIFYNGDEYFRALFTAIDQAQISVDIEIYMYAADEVGRELAHHLTSAAQRAVKVRVIVDGIGSLGWILTYGKIFSDSGISFKIYHKAFWESYAVKNSPPSSLMKWLKAIGQINKRTHRKLIIIDGKSIFIGSRNISACHSEKVSGENAWKDISLKVTGKGADDLLYAFNRSWAVSPPREWKKFILGRRTEFSPFVKLNFRRSVRKKNYRDLLRTIRNARNRVWIASSYFVPSPSSLRALISAGRKGRDVRILVPSKSDIFFLPWVIPLFYPVLLKNGVKIYEFLPTFLHSKIIMADDWIIVGSSNFNHRSVIHDLEADIVLSAEDSIRSVEKCFLEYLKSAKEITKSNVTEYGFFKTALGHIALLLKYWC